jgi:hypothetical protein
MSEPPTEWVDQVLGAARERGAPLVSAEVLRQRGERVTNADLSGHHIQVPLSLLAWVGRTRHVGVGSTGTGQWRWVCQVQDAEMARDCGTVGSAPDEFQAIVDLGEHLRTEHGATPIREI